jgi:phage/plasmid-like protein (TIGR03299 family)
MHALTERANGMVEMAYMGEVPWHGLGQRLTEGASIEAWQQEAGMDWLVKRSRVRFGEAEVFNEHHVLFRSDTKAPLGIVGEGYKIVQPPEVLEFFRDLVADSGFTLHTAGTMFGGKRFWALASINESACILGQDRVDGYLLLTTSCDGSMATTAKFTTVRVVCNNTLSMALSSKDAGDIKISHRTSFNHAAVKDRLGIVTNSFASFVQASRMLSNRPVSQMRASELTQQLMIGGTEKEDVKESKGYKGIIQLFNGGKGNNGESLWDWVNGVTEYVDHGMNAKSESHRLANSWYGAGDSLKTKAMGMALELCK